MAAARWAVVSQRPKVWSLCVLGTPMSKSACETTTKLQNTEHCGWFPRITSAHTPCSQKKKKKTIHGQAYSGHPGAIW
eukprot:5483215-Prymnesium_polylepis.1